MTYASKKICEHLASGEYRQAYRIGSEALQLKGDDPAVLSALRELSAKLRFECMSMAARKADCGADYFNRENLLHEINVLTGEDMYGNTRRI